MEKYSYSDDWDEIYSDYGKKKPWVEAKIPDCISDKFSDHVYKKSHSDDHIIDIGCGDGSLCKHLGKNGYKHVTGIDTSNVIIEQCKKRNTYEGVTYEQKDIIQGSFPVNAYDIVFCLLVLHHIQRKDLDSFKNNITGLCKPGGTVYLSFMTPLEEGQKEHDSFLSKKHKLIFYDSEDIKRLFSTDFTVREVGYGKISSPDYKKNFEYKVLALDKLINSRQEWDSVTEKFELKSLDYAKENIFEFLEKFAVYSQRSDVLLQEKEFKSLYDKMFGVVSKYICRRIVDKVEKKGDYITILKMDTHDPEVVFYSASQWSEQNAIPKYRFLNQSQSTKDNIQSRAYDLFIAYQQYWKDKEVPPKKRISIHHHFKQDPKLPSFSIHKENDKLVFSPNIYFERDSDYVSFLRAFFSGETTGNSGFLRYLKEQEINHNLKLCTSTANSFYCFNLGIAGFESWGTLLIESRDEIINENFIDTELNIEITNLIFALKKIEYDYYTTKYKKSINAQATKAAIAQVMVRNMSHNFGSHVLSKLMDNNVCDRITANSTDAVSSNYTCLFSYENDPTPHLAHFNSYLKSRMDYLSEVTFGVSNMVTTRMVYGNVMRDLDCQRLLLNNISGIDGFKYNFIIRHNGKDLDCNSDIAAAFPGDVLGCQAFYNIIENIIRNTAKHHRGNITEGGVIFHIDIKDIDEEKNFGADEASGLYCVEITNGLAEKDIESIVEQQNKLINTSVLDSNNNLRSNALGLLEMKASAAFLRQIDMIDVSSKIYMTEKDSDYHIHDDVKRMSLLKAFEAGESKKALGYRFYLQKPKMFLFAGNAWSVNDEGRKKSLKSLGIHFVNATELENSLNAGKAFQHLFLYYDDTTRKIVREKKNQSLLPLRCISKDAAKNDIDINQILTTTDYQDILSGLKKKTWPIIKNETAVKGARQVKQEPYIVFKHHKDTYEDDYKELFEGKEENDFEGKDIWVENFTSRTMYKLPEFSTLSQVRNPNRVLDGYVSNLRLEKHLLCELHEAYHNRVIIVDERVQEFAEINEEDTIPCWKLFLSTNVRIPRRDVIPLAAESLNEYAESIKKYVDLRIENSFLIIHYGILERMYSRDEGKITQTLEDWANLAKRIVVTSGRGAHSLNLPETVCFANLSSVLYACKENRNKYLINSLIYQARRK